MHHRYSKASTGLNEMSIIEMGEKVVSDLDSAIEPKIVSAVVYGKDIHKEFDKDVDCNLLLVLEKVDLPTIEMINNKIKGLTKGCMKTPLVIEVEEIEGMMDSAPPTFLQILMSYQTVYGKSILKGLSSLNHEHLRAQTEQNLREQLFCARYNFLRGLDNEDTMRSVLMDISETLSRSLKLYYMIKKPWITDEKEKWDSFREDFDISDPWTLKFPDFDDKEMNLEEMKKIGMAIINSGLKPLLEKVDSMGP